MKNQSMADIMARKKKSSRLDIHKNYVQPDPYETESEHFAKLATKEDSKANILKQYSHYIDRLAVFHTDVMELLRYMEYHWIGTDNRFATKAKIAALIKQGKEIEYNDSDDSHINLPNSHNSYGVKDYTREVTTHKPTHQFKG